MVDHCVAHNESFSSTGSQGYGFVLAADAAGPAFQRLAEANHIFLAGELIHLQVLFYDYYVSFPWEDSSLNLFPRRLLLVVVVVFGCTQQLYPCG